VYNIVHKPCHGRWPCTPHARDRWWQLLKKTIIMKYSKFIIHSYRGISEETIIDISREPLIPIIGKNESGKTTFLEAIFSFDNINDDVNEGRHLKNIENLYSADELPIKIEAEIEIPKKKSWSDFFEEELKTYAEAYQGFSEDIRKVNLKEVDFNYIDSETQEDLKYEKWEYIRAYQILTSVDLEKINIIRDLKTRKYECKILSELTSSTLNTICKRIVKQLPYILYFDDFRDRLPDKIYLVEDEDHDLYSPWITYIKELFRQTKDTYTISTLPTTDERRRKSIIKQVQKELNQKLVEEWSNYQFEKTENIEVQIEYEPHDPPYLKFSIEEKISINGEVYESYFEISDRSKGFYWYMNFMMKLHYNPKKRDDEDKDTVYLLDEPGSYLHTYALSKLAEQLKNIAENNKVIYCTHSHNLLNPEVIPINSIRLSEKKDGKISLKRIDHKGMLRPSRNSAYQSIFDALEVKPPMLEFSNNKIVLLEGIYDYYCFNMFTNSELSFFPCVSASSILNQIPYMIFLGKLYIALWDNDSEGRERLKKAAKLFGEHEAKKFMTLSSISEKKDTVLEDLFSNVELKKYANVETINKEFLKKIILELYYSSDRKKLISKNFPLTSKNFQDVEKTIINQMAKL